MMHNGFCNLNLILNLDHVIILFINLYCMIANDRNKNLLLTGALIHEVFTAVGWIMYRIFICLKCIIVIMFELMDGILCIPGNI